MGTPSRRAALHSRLHPPDTAEVWVRYKTGGQKRDLGVGKKKFWGIFTHECYDDEDDQDDEDVHVAR